MDASSRKTSQDNRAGEHPNIINRDWRIEAITVLSQDFIQPGSNNIISAGTAAEAVAFIKYNNDTIGITIPNAAALYFSLARSLRNTGFAFFEQEFSQYFEPGPNHNLRGISIEIEPKLFDALSNLMASVIFSYTTLEVYTNSTIPDDYIYEVERSDHKCKEVYSRDQIERFVNLDTKLDQVLPPICSVKSPKGTKIWDNYIWLKKLRDRLVHLKTSDWRTSPPEQAKDYLWTLLLDKRSRYLPETVLELINHYANNRQKRWIYKLSEKNS